MLVNINLDEIREIAYVGIRRAAIFLGFSINCANRDDCKDFALTNYSMYRFTKEEISEAVIDEYKSEYQKWITANAFSELVNSFEVFLDAIFQAASYINMPNKKIIRDFTKNGISLKLKILKEYFKIHIDLLESFESINKVRNCLYHRRGNVTERDINSQDKKLIVKWLGLDIHYEKEDGEIIKIETPVIDTYVVGKGKSIIVKTNERAKQFNVGEIIDFSIKELSEICYHFNIEVDSIFGNLTTYFKEHNIEVKAKS